MGLGSSFKNLRNGIVLVNGIRWGYSDLLSVCLYSQRLTSWVRYIDSSIYGYNTLLMIDVYLQKRDFFQKFAQAGISLRRA